MKLIVFVKLILAALFTYTHISIYTLNVLIFPLPWQLHIYLLDEAYLPNQGWFEGLSKVSRC